MNKNFDYLLLLLGTFFVLSSCIPESTRSVQAPAVDKWLYANLKLIDPVDASSPVSDLIAAYTRVNGSNFEIRLDYLQNPADSNFKTTILIKLDSVEYSTSDVELIQWDYQIEIQNQSQSQLIDISSGRVVMELETPIFQDQDYLVVSIPTNILPADQQNVLFSCFVSDPKNYETLDKLGPFSLQDKNNPAPSRLLISFWDVFTGDTPAQALRSWNGAHSGPFGSRHGLVYLLNSVTKYRVPVVLVDLKTPENLQGLDYMNSLEMIRSMYTNGLLILPDTAYGFNYDRTLPINREIFKTFQISDRRLLYGNFNGLDIPETTTVFAVSKNTNSLEIYENGVTGVPLPLSYLDKSTPFTNQTNASDPFQFPVQLKAELIKVATSANPEDFVNFGESFSKSALGDPSISDKFFAYIDNHPWIESLPQIDLDTDRRYDIHDELCSDLLCSPPLPDIQPHTIFGTTNPDALNYDDLAEQIKGILVELPDNEISQSAWLMYQKYMDPANSVEDHLLQANYLGQIGHLAQASKWLDSPSALHECLDLDWDGLPECILSNQRIFSSYEIEGGRLLYLYIINYCGVIPVINPFSQYAPGLSDPDLWDINKGYLSDPNEISGFLADRLDHLGNYSVEISKNTIEFQDNNSQIRKLFTLDWENLSIQASYPFQTEVVIPLAANLSTTKKSGNTLQLLRNKNPLHSIFQNDASGGENVCLEIDVPGQDVQITSYTDSSAYMESPENPDQAYPPGHYLPFPFQTIQFLINKEQIIHIYSPN